MLGFRRKSSDSEIKPYQSPQRGEFTAKEHDYMTKYLDYKDKDLTSQGLNGAAGRAAISKTSHQTDQILAPDYHFNSVAKKDLEKPVVTRQAEPEVTNPYGKSDGHWSGSKDTSVEPEPKTITVGAKEEQPVVTDMGQLGSLMSHDSWTPPTNLYESARWSKSQESLKTNEPQGRSFSKDDSDTKTLYEEPLPVANGFQHNSASTGAPNFRDEPIQFTRDSRRDSTFSTTSTLRDEPIGYAGDKNHDPFVSNPSKDSKSFGDYGQTQKQALTPWSRKEEQEWDKLSDKKIFHGSSMTKAELYRLEELNARAPQVNPNEIF